MKNHTNTFDLIIIGGGAGAFAAAIAANELRAKTAIINSGLPIGGTCVNVGCVPSKTLLWAGELLYQARHHNIPGIELSVKKMDFSDLIKHELDLVKRMRREKYEKVLQHMNFVTLIKGKARFVSKHEIEVNGTLMRAQKYIIATGSTARIPNINGLRETGFITHIEALKLKKQPKDLVVIGAGPVGLEFAQMFCRFGTRVTILQHGSEIFPRGDNELSDSLSKLLVDEGIKIKTNTEIVKARKDNKRKMLTIASRGKREEIYCDEILVAAGKTPNTGGLGLEHVGVQTNKHQAVVVNKYFQTTKSHIFAVGDVADSPLRLETTAGREGTLAAKNALNTNTGYIDYNTVPYTIFTDPQLAGVGITEEEQVKKMGVCSCRTVLFSNVPKAVITHKTQGMIKMVVHPRSKQIMGVQVLGSYASEIIAIAAVLIKNKNTIDDAIEMFPVFPTFSEAIHIAALSFKKDISKLSCCT